MKREYKPSPAVTGLIEISHIRSGVFIGGDPAGLRSLANLFNWLADVEQEVLNIPDGEQWHVHLHPGKPTDSFASLTEQSEDTEICRLDRKGM